MNTDSSHIRTFLEQRMPDLLLDGFFISAEPLPQMEPRFGDESGLSATIHSDSPWPGEFYFCAPYEVVSDLAQMLLGSDDTYDVHDLMAELANLVAGRIARDLQSEIDREPKIGLPKVGQGLFPTPQSLDIHLRFRVEDSHLAVGWKAATS